jgi:hypothetical protein
LDNNIFKNNPTIESKSKSSENEEWNYIFIRLINNYNNIFHFFILINKYFFWIISFIYFQGKKL